MGLGVWELLLILIIVLIVFGAAKLPQLGEALGKGIKSFKKATSETDEIDVSPQKEQLKEKSEVPKVTEGEQQKEAAEETSEKESKA